MGTHNFVICTLISQILVMLVYSGVNFSSAISLEYANLNMKYAILGSLEEQFELLNATEQVSPHCRSHSQLYLQDVANLTPWAVNMFAASGNILTAVTRESEDELGNYDQCLGIEVLMENHTIFRGQQCRINFSYKNERNSKGIKDDSDMELFFESLVNATMPDQDETYIMAVCVPSSCSSADVQEFVTGTIERYNISSIDVKVNPNDCSYLKKNEFSNADYAMIGVILLFLTLILLSTCYDLCIKEEHGNHYRVTAKHHFLASFSLYSNGKALLSTHTSPDSITCLHGLRFLSIMWVLLGHTVFMESVTPHINRNVLKHFSNNIGNILVMNATLSTDTFLLLSGTLLSYMFLREMDKKFSYNIITMYFYRYIRLTPPYAFVIFFYATLLYHLGSGPLWDSQVGTNRDYCLENWWTNLLYVNNYLHVDRMCISQSWYMAVDMQLFLLSPIFLYPLVKWPRFGKALLGICIVSSVIIPLVITFVLHLPATMLYNKNPVTLGEVYLQIYTRTYARAGPYLIGIDLGYMLYKTRGKSFSKAKIYVVLGWLLSTSICLAVLLGVIVFYKDNHVYNLYESSVYAGFHRTAWALGIAWIIFACAKGCGGPVNALLSWKVFIPLSRLTYCIYLCHFILLLYEIGTTRTPNYMAEFNILQDVGGNALMSIILAGAISLAFEMPFVNMLKLRLRRPTGIPENCVTDTIGTSVASSSVLAYESGNCTFHNYNTFTNKNMLVN